MISNTEQGAACEFGAHPDKREVLPRIVLVTHVRTPSPAILRVLCMHMVRTHGKAVGWLASLGIL